MPGSAQLLLESYLSPNQLEYWGLYHHFFVVSRRGNVYQLHDGMSVVSYYSERPDTPYYVWAVESYRRQASTALSLITQLLHLRSKVPSSMLDLACTGGRYAQGSKGCPRMTGQKAVDRALWGI